MSAPDDGQRSLPAWQLRCSESLQRSRRRRIEEHYQRRISRTLVAFALLVAVVPVVLVGGLLLGWWSP